VLSFLLLESVMICQCDVLLVFAKTWDEGNELLRLSDETLRLDPRVHGAKVQPLHAPVVALRCDHFDRFNIKAALL